tara:strand:- start:1069 stop:1518 length:450 start_codon:yes stop_codon:yes gene_type:complete
MGFEKADSKPWVIKKIVLPQHTDHAGVMWHGSYVSWLEEARIHALSKVGLSYKDLSKEGYEMPVVEMGIKFLSTLSHGEEVTLESWVLPSKGLRFPWKTKFSSKSKKTNAIANIDLVLIRISNAEMKLLRNPPPHIEKALISLQNGPEF